MASSDQSFNILRLLETPGLGAVRVNHALELAARSNASIDDALNDASFLTDLIGSSRRTEWLAAEETADRILTELRNKQIHLLAITDPRYPSILRALLKKKAPPLLFFIGNPDLLQSESVGFCGSRQASPKGVEVARDCSAQLSESGINVISGFARGVDMAAHVAALRNGGATTIVLAEGVLHFRLKQEIARVWDDDRVVVISEFPPRLPWKVHSAMHRNRTICALSKAMILIEARVTGGSFAAGRTSLQLGIPLFTPVYDGLPIEAEGNRELMSMGARPLFKRRISRRANLRPLFEALGRPAPKARPE